VIIDPTVLPAGLPEPEDDRAAFHLLGRPMPTLALPSTSGGRVRVDLVFLLERRRHVRLGAPSEGTSTGSLQTQRSTMANPVLAFRRSPEIRQLRAVKARVRVQPCGKMGVSLVGADNELGVDEFEFARRRLTAAAYGFRSWTDFRAWRKRNPAEYRERSRRLFELPDPGREPAIVIELPVEAHRMRRKSVSLDEPAGS
jgi:hypothetical protein